MELLTYKHNYKLFCLTARDATMAFENAHHSTETREMMHAFYVGQYVDVSLIGKV